MMINHSPEIVSKACGGMECAAVPERAANMTVLFPVVALTISIFAEGYRVTPLAGVGLLFILVGNLLVFARWRRRPMPEVPAAKV